MRRTIWIPAIAGVALVLALFSCGDRWSEGEERNFIDACIGASSGRAVDCHCALNKVKGRYRASDLDRVMESGSADAISLRDRITRECIRPT